MKNKLNIIWAILILVFINVSFVQAAALPDQMGANGVPPTIKSGGLIIQQGNVGIGINDPQSLLHLDGSILFNSGGITFSDASTLTTAPTFSNLPDSIGSYTGLAGQYVVVNETEDGVTTVASALTAPGAANQVVKSDGAGNFEGAGLYSDSTGVGIGTASPTMELDVAGGIRRALHLHGAQTTSFTVNAATNEHSVSISADISLSLNNLLSGATASIYVTNTAATTSFVSIPTSYENGNSKTSFAVPPGKEAIASFYIANGSTNIVLSGEFINYTETTSAPTVGDDEDDGYTKGTLWRNTSTDALYLLADPTVGSAVWVGVGIVADDSITAAKMADGDHGDFTYASNVATLDTGVVGANELDEAGVADGLEAVMQLQDMQGAVTVSQLPTLTYTKDLTIQNPEAAQEFTMFYTPVAITITELATVLIGSSTPSVTVDIHHSTDRSAAGNALITTPSATTSTTTGSVITSFDDATIPADSWVWVEIDAQSGTVTECFVNVSYTKD